MTDIEVTNRGLEATAQSVATMPVWIAILFGSLASIGSIASAVAAWTALRITSRTFESQKRKAAPSVRVFARLHEDEPQVILLVIENIGGSIAYDIKFKISKSLPARAWGLGSTDQSEARQMVDGPLINGIPALGPGEKRIIMWGDFAGLHGYLGDQFVTVEAKCRDESRVEQPPRLSILEIKSFEGNDASRNDPATRMEQRLAHIHRELQVLGTSNRPLIVETLRRQRDRENEIMERAKQRMAEAAKQ